MMQEQRGTTTFEEVVDQIGPGRVDRKRFLVNGTLVKLGDIKNMLKIDGKTMAAHVLFSDGTVVELQDMMLSESVAILNKQTIRFSRLQVDQLKRLIGMQFQVTVLGNVKVITKMKNTKILKRYMLTVF